MEIKLHSNVLTRNLHDNPCISFMDPCRHRNMKTDIGGRKQLVNVLEELIKIL